MSTRILRHAVLLAALAVLPACAAPVSTPAGGPVPATAAGLPTVQAAAATITPERIFSRIDFLAADEMRGAQRGRRDPRAATRRSATSTWCSRRTWTTWASAGR
jgi:hypothetical protein